MTDNREQLEFEELLSTIKLQNRQHATEIWKVVLAAIVAGAVLGGTLVQIANMVGSAQ